MRARQIIPTALCGALVAVLGATPILLLAGVPPLPHAFLLVTIIGAAAGLAGAIVACTAWPRSKTPGPQAEEPTDAERTFRTMAASIPCAVFRCSLDEHWTMHIIGRQIEEITGYPASGFLHNAVRSYASIIHPDDLVSVKEDVFTAAAANQPWTLEYRIRHADDTYRFVFERGRTVRDHAGEVKYLDGFILDNAARHRAEQALRDEKLFADTALNSLPGLFYVFDSEGRFLRWNNNLATVSGYTDKEIAGMAALDFFADEGRETAREAVREAFVSGEHSMENDLFTKSGEKIPHFFTGVR
ncbi:MAG: PAS domain-containing protein, partial [bacterium]|nr:PAS domain-containing protein [bacterium]